MYKLSILLVGLLAITYVNGHGRFMKPVSRSSIWRVPEFAGQNPPANYDDNQLYCGGKHQAEVVGGECGVCGDPWAQASPRDNEVNGKYYRGIITGEYQAGQVIDIEIDLTTSHLGYMEFRLCTNPMAGETQDCFNQHVLQLADGSGTKLNAGATGLMRTQVRLPEGVRTEHGSIQWNYRAGNGWGQCEDGSFATGCGPQETFRGCSDVRIN